MTKYNKGLI